jgi:hypothetical protein
MTSCGPRMFSGARAEQQLHENHQAQTHRFLFASMSRLQALDSTTESEPAGVDLSLQIYSAICRLCSMPFPAL